MTRARSVSKLGNPDVFTVDTDANIGVNSTSPVEKLNVVGVVSATSFFGDGSNLTGVSASELSGTPDIVIRNVTGVAATFTGVVSYEDVTNIDSVGIITAQSGLRVVGGGATVTGVSTFFDNVNVIGITTVGILTAYTTVTVGTAITADSASGIITATGVNVTGIVTAASYRGDGSSLTGISVDASSLKDSGSTVRAQANTSGIVVTGICTATGVNVLGVCTATSFDGNGNDIVDSTWTLGSNGNVDYTFTGPGLTGAENDPTIYLTRGQTYKFVNGMGAHPFRIQSDPNGSTGTQYNDGVTNNDVSSGTLTWDVQFDAPDTLYYQCTSHANMGGIIYIGDNTRSLANIAKSSGYTLIKSDTNKLINMTSSGTVTVPSGIFSAGDIITVYNNNTSTMSVSASGTTLRKAGTTDTGTCTLAVYGTASILCVSSNVFVVSGNIS